MPSTEASSLPFSLLTLPIGRQWIAAHIPHQGAMCLLDEVKACDAENLSCIAYTHRQLDNPLRKAGRLGIMCGIEYAAQAIAVHCALVADGRVGGNEGFIATLRDVQSQVTRLDDLVGALQICVQRQSASPSGAMYGFSLWYQQRQLQSGRMTLMFSDNMESRK